MSQKKELEKIIKMLVKRDFELMKEREAREKEVLTLEEIKVKSEKQNKELNKINILMIGREKRMIDLKKEAKKLREESEKLRKKTDGDSQK